MNVKIILGDYRYVIRSCIGLDLNFKAELAHRGQQGGGWRVEEGGGCSSCCWGHPGRQLLPLSLSLSLVHSLALIHCPFYSVSHMHTLTCFRDNGPAEPPASKSGVCHLSSPQRPQRNKTLCSSSLTKEPENTSSHVTPICTHAVYLKVELSGECNCWLFLWASNNIV